MKSENRNSRVVQTSSGSSPQVWTSEGSSPEVKELKNPASNTTAGQAIKSDVGLGDFISRTYRFTGGGIMTTLIMTSVLSSVPGVTDSLVLPMIGGGFVLAIGSGFLVDYTKYQIHQEEGMFRGQKHEYLYSTNSPLL